MTLYVVGNENFYGKIQKILFSRNSVRSALLRFTGSRERIERVDKSVENGYTRYDENKKARKR